MSRPDQILLVLVVAGAGVAAGVAGGAPMAPLRVVIGALALVMATVSIHMVNEAADIDTDAVTTSQGTRTPFSGGSGAAARAGLPRQEVRAFGVAVASLAAAASVSIVLTTTAIGLLPAAATGALVLGLAGGWAYSVGPAVSRRGGGEVLNAVLGGLLLPVFGVATVTGRLEAGDVALFVPFTLLVVVSMLETQWPDRHADRATGKHTLTSRLSSGQVRAVGATITALGYVLVVLLGVAGMPVEVVLAFTAAAPVSVVAVRRLGRAERPGPAVAAMVIVAVGQLVAWTVVAATSGDGGVTPHG